MSRLVGALGDTCMGLKELSPKSNDAGMVQDDPRNSYLSLATLPPSSVQEPGQLLKGTGQ